MTLKRSLFLVATSLMLTLEALAFDATRAQNAIDKFAGAASLKNASLTIAVASTADGKVLATHNPDLACITASTMKTVTSTAALELLGGDFVFETPVYLDGEVKNGVLNGNLLIVGSGDPTLGSRFFKDNLDIVPEIMQALKGAGISAINGRIIVDQSKLPFPAFSDCSDAGDLAWPYCAGIHALNYSDNRVRLVFDGNNGSMQNARFEPNVPGLKIINRLSAGTDDNAELHMEYASPAVIVSGTVADTTYYFDIANPLPGALLADSLEHSMQRAGIKLRNRDIKASDSPWLMLTHRSPLLTDIIASLLERSDNMFTEGLLRAMAVNKGVRPTAKAGVDAVNESLIKRGIDVTPKFQYDGSGLARANKATATFFTAMLALMADRHYGAKQQRLVDLMPRVGINANIGGYLSESSLSGSVAVKSGSMTGVQCYVGYYPAQKPEYCFAILVNNWHGTRQALKNDIDRLIMRIFDAN
ncbi:MAG: D-alanyl-D-alanine carboxypeptidase/D-alanyl-D-alanine-endopeptidase [Muribaculaceae bacterium]|nr:D-alanyl-D-alanine carboxypeptidase/D-alanyl-D-alanine-endopeptidase [Muribaculaceae bacterium]